MTPEEIIQKVELSLRECFDSTPLSALEGIDAKESWDDLVAKFICELSSNGVYLVDRECYDAARTPIAEARKKPSVDKVCPKCFGVGFRRVSESHTTRCVHCSGVGRVNP